MATWLITGCSTGFGRELASAVLARNWNAVVTARDPATIQDIVAGHDVSALALRLDVTDPKQVASAVKEAEARFGAIDVLVNNAGYGYRGAVEEADETEVRELFETNFFGLVSMIQAVLPGMRAHRRGHIVNISSVAGRMAQPGSGYYSATKFAVGGLSDALRKEVGPLGIRVTVVEPGGFRTDFAGRSLRQSKHTIDDYAATAGARRKENSSTDGRQPGDPARAAQAIIRAVQADKPPFRLALGRSAVQRIRTEIDTQRQELDAWEETANGADYPA
ncbi:MAG: short-chain dehydrogenase/reductase [Alphaproteobacteria bacterium 65-37]|jgi:NAD(P)-dependent dehydrogenase (short-subunit alcohol dehydrogenase family)|nr:MAG: short-chain dehydrogenase/reductase [Alphaproteobacteria bacterium 65-37]